MSPVTGSFDLSVGGISPASCDACSWFVSLQPRIPLAPPSVPRDGGSAAVGIEERWDWAAANEIRRSGRGICRTDGCLPWPLSRGGRAFVFHVFNSSKYLTLTNLSGLTCIDGTTRVRFETLPITSLCHSLRVRRRLRRRRVPGGNPLVINSVIPGRSLASRSVANSSVISFACTCSCWQLSTLHLPRMKL